VTRWAYPALALVTGAAVTVFEFAAPNLFRAYFGQTIYVWANVIGVILGALAIGYALGGRWADRTQSTLPLAFVLAFAGGYALLVGLFGPRVSAWLAGPEEYTQNAAIRAYVAQSLAASLILFGPPLIALGMATPLMVQRASADWPVGRAAGVIFGVGTLGSLCGIYLTTFVLVEHLGVRTTITLAAAGLLVLGALLFFASRLSKAAVACLLCLGLAPLGLKAPWATLPPEGSSLVLAIESPYQLIRVVDRPPDREGGISRWLTFDEGTGTFHSVQVTENTLWTGAYYDAFSTLPEWVGGKPPLRVCILGNAAGTMGDLLHLHNPECEFRIDGVEIDPEVTEAARRTMGLKEREDIRIFHADGRTFLQGCPHESYDAIILDAYARQVSIPAALATKEFFSLAKSRLRRGGILFVNLGAMRPGGLLVRTLCDTMAAGFNGPVFRCPLEFQTNVLLVAARDATAPPPPKRTKLLAAASFGLHLPGDAVLTDDFCPVESLTVRDLLLE
jgi:predicted membrane-bound spermidine synthase